MAEIGEWNGLTPVEAARVFRGCGLPSHTVTNLGVRGKGFSRFELIGLAAELEAEFNPAPEEAPLRTWGCRDCFHQWETTDRIAICPECESDDTKLAPPSRAPGVKSQRTTSLDNVVRDTVESYGLTDYTNQRPRPLTPVINSPTGPVTVAQGGDVGRALGVAKPGQMGLALNTGTGKAILNPSIRTREMFSLPQRRGTQVIASDNRPLPRV